MITSIPTSGEYQEAGVNLLHLAWQIAMETTKDFEEAEELLRVDEDALAEASAIYWAKSQPALGNAISLVQQAMEMGLKGRISEVSPFLLIARDPKEWPRGSDRQPTPFSSFRSLDAADLVKVHNTFAMVPLDDAFQNFWGELRRERNALMHSVALREHDSALLIRTILTAAQLLFDDTAWPQRLIKLEAEGRYSGFGLDDYDRNIIMEQIDRATRHLTPAESKRFLNFDTRRRAYACPACLNAANRDFQEYWPHLAQLVSKSGTETDLLCAVCATVTKVDRARCISPHCKANVIHEGLCLTYHWSQDTPQDFPSALRLPDPSAGTEFQFRFRRGTFEDSDRGRFASSNDAIKHALLAMKATYLSSWELVEVRAWPNLSLGHWLRVGPELNWSDKPAPNIFSRIPPRPLLLVEGSDEERLGPHMMPDHETPPQS